MKKLVSVVIPIYKNSFSKDERISFERTISLLIDYPITIIKPDNIDVSSLLSQYNNNFHIESFKDYYFADIKGYNHLMLDYEFYNRFRSYKYILICQLDVYIFRNELEEWCKLNFDYIGAPWLRKKKYDLFYNRVFWSLKRMIYRALAIKSFHDVFDKVGNGGFSLRNVETAKQALTNGSQIAEQYKRKCQNKRFNEDVFWALEMPRICPNPNIPTKEVAVKFAFDVQVDECYELNNRNLPFGAHGWYKRLSFYQEFIPFK